MHCEWCPLCPTEKDDDECGYFEQYGKKYKDGQYGCTTPRNKIEKLDDEYSQYLGDMGLDMGIEIDFQHYEWSMEETIDMIKHMIGLDYHKPYMRHDKLFYKPYRNYFSFNPKNDNKSFEYLSGESIGILRRYERYGDNCGFICYSLTEIGRRWLSRSIGIMIKEPDCGARMDGEYYDI